MLMMLMLGGIHSSMIVLMLFLGASQKPNKAVNDEKARSIELVIHSSDDPSKAGFVTFQI